LEARLPWFRLKSVPGVGNLLFKRLMDRFRRPEAVLEASEDELLQVEGMSQRLARAILNHGVPEQVRRELDRLALTAYQVVTMADSGYPPLLREIPDPPPFLYVYGSLPVTTKAIAVVGSRNATDYGLHMTRRLCADLAVRQMMIVSGMARGIDTAAHEGALQGKGKTVAVLGSGLERIYPSQNKDLFHRIAENGAVISEFALQAEPEAHHFPLRNRIISGMCLGTVVVEATKKSGSLITARLAAEQNREVFAVPGSVQSFKSIGTHTLIKQGAKLVEHAQDILDEFPQIETAAPTAAPELQNPLPPLSPMEAQVYAALGPYPVHIDDLGRKISLESGKLAGILLQLELKGIVQQLPGKYFTVIRQ
jgi:DNA processing protein